MDTKTCLIILVVSLLVIASVAMPFCGKKYRLGNEIDLWFTRNLKFRAYLLFDSDRKGFVKHLHNNAPNSAYVKVDYSGPSAYITYSYDSLKKHIRPFRKELRKAMIDYFKDLKRFYTPGQCVIHYRTGDFMNNVNYGARIVTPKHIVNQVVDLKPDSVLLLDGGSRFHAGEQTLTRLDPNRVDRVKNEIRQRLRDNHIFFTEASGSADEDFVTMACADYLVTGLGSFAIAAAVANTTGTIRTPAMDLLNPNDMKEIKSYSRSPETIAKKWKTFYSG